MMASFRGWARFVLAMILLQWTYIIMYHNEMTPLDLDNLYEAILQGFNNNINNTVRTYGKERLQIKPEERISEMNQKAIVSRREIKLNVTFRGKDEIDRLSPPRKVLEQTSIQLDDELLIFIGGFIDNYNNASRFIQFFNITNQRWISERELELPPGIAETHQGSAFDPSTRMLYIVAGQLGGTCLPATNAVARIQIDTGAYDILPSLPAARYDPGVGLVVSPSRKIKYLHAFGGTSEMRNRSATDHWRLRISSGDLSLPDEKWQQLESVPDGGGHGVSFVRRGYIYYTAFSQMDQGVAHVRIMQQCQEAAFSTGGQILHHFADVGFLFRYATEFAVIRRNQTKKNLHWERLQDMPFPACHTGMLLDTDSLLLIGGGITTTQTKFGSSPNSLNMVQQFNFDTLSWSSRAFSLPKGTKAYRMGVWIDRKRKHIYGLRAGETTFFAPFFEYRADPLSISRQTEQQKKNRAAYLLGERKLSVNAITRCIDLALAQLPGNQTMTKYTMYDANYDEVRAGWNKRTLHLQYPDVITFPKSPRQVSLIVQCAKRTGHHICGRNGKHSFEGDTCTYGVVVDVANLNSVKLLGQRSIRFGSGIHTGRVAMELKKFGLILPLGHCASVGLTGLVLVGGQGVLTRHLGMTIDFVSAIELVDHNGQIIYATKSDEYSDYVWLARGGGSSVLHFPGIITAVEFANLPQFDVSNSTEKVYTTFKINYPATTDQAVRLLTSWQEFYLDPANIVDPLFSRVTIEPWLFRNRLWDEQNELFISCYFYGNDILHRHFMDRLFPKIKRLVHGSQEITNVRRLGMLEFTQELAGVKDWRELSSGQHGWDLYEVQTSQHKTQNRWKAYSAVASGRVSARAFHELAEQIFNSQPLNRRYVELKPLGSAVKNHDQTESAFWHRNAIWWSLTSHWHWSTDPIETIDAIQQNAAKSHMEYIKEMGESYSGGYAGYIHHGNSIGADLELYYGGNAERIAEVKKHRDPSNLFRLYSPNSDSNAPFQVYTLT